MASIRINFNKDFQTFSASVAVGQVSLMNSGSYEYATSALKDIIEQPYVKDVLFGSMTDQEFEEKANQVHHAKMSQMIDG